MPLFVDDEQVQPKRFAMDLGIKSDAFDRLVKKPSFRLDASREVKKKTIKSPEKPMFGIKSSFWFKDKDGLTKKLTYAESRSPKIEAGVKTWVYAPTYINLKAGLVAFPKDESKALYMFLRPGNPASPFAGSKKMFTFIDTVAETLLKASNMSELQRALTHATSVEEEELVILAKGLKILTSDDYDIADLRVNLQEFAVKFTKRYVDGMENEMVRIEGRIRNLVDKGMFKIEKRGNARQWIWDMESKRGELIGDLIMNPNDDAMLRLMNHIKSNLADYIYDLRNTTVILQADRKAKEFLQAEKPKNDVPDHLSILNSGTTGVLNDVESTIITQDSALKDKITTFQEARDYLGDNGYGKSSVHAKALLAAIQEDHVNGGTIKNFLVHLTAKE
jgi:hypothetical protein